MTCLEVGSGSALADTVNNITQSSIQNSTVETTLERNDQSSSTYKNQLNYNNNLAPTSSVNTSLVSQNSQAKPSSEKETLTKDGMSNDAKLFYRETVTRRENQKYNLEVFGNSFKGVGVKVQNVKDKTYVYYESNESAFWTTPGYPACSPDDLSEDKKYEAATNMPWSKNFHGVISSQYFNTGLFEEGITLVGAWSANLEKNGVINNTVYFYNDSDRLLTGQYLKELVDKHLENVDAKVDENHPFSFVYNAVGTGELGDPYLELSPYIILIIVIFIMYIPAQK